MATLPRTTYAAPQTMRSHFFNHAGLRLHRSPRRPSSSSPVSTHPSTPYPLASHPTTPSLSVPIIALHPPTPHRPPPNSIPAIAILPPTPSPTSIAHMAEAYDDEDGGKPGMRSRRSSMRSTSSTQTINSVLSEARQMRGRRRMVGSWEDETGGMVGVMEPRVEEGEWGVLGISEVLEGGVLVVDEKGGG